MAIALLIVGLAIYASFAQLPSCVRGTGRIILTMLAGYFGTYTFLLCATFNAQWVPLRRFRGHRSYLVRGGRGQGQPFLPWTTHGAGLIPVRVRSNWVSWPAETRSCPGAVAATARTRRIAVARISEAITLALIEVVAVHAYPQITCANACRPCRS